MTSSCSFLVICSTKVCLCISLITPQCLNLGDWQSGWFIFLLGSSHTHLRSCYSKCFLKQSGSVRKEYCVTVEVAIKVSITDHRWQLGAEIIFFTKSIPLSFKSSSFSNKAYAHSADNAPHHSTSKHELNWAEQDHFYFWISLVRWVDWLPAATFK